jgi:hypothetical protein
MNIGWLSEKNRHLRGREQLLQTIGRLQFPVLNPATTFQRPEVDLDAPASGIPFHLFLIIGKALDLGSLRLGAERFPGQDHPTQALGGQKTLAIITGTK